MLLLNFGFLFITGVSIYFTSLYIEKFLLFVPIVFVAVLLLTWCIYGTSVFIWKLKLNEKTRFRDYIFTLGNGFKRSLSFGVFFALYTIIIMTALPFYFSIKSLASYIPALLICSCILISLPSILLLVPMGAVSSSIFVKTFKDSVRMFITEPKIIIAITVNSVCIFLISILTAFFIPGITIAIFILEDTCSLLSLIYEEDLDEPGILRLIAQEEKMAGNRSFKNLIAPWKK